MNAQIMITIEREFNVLSIERMAYTTFDMLSDVGGLSGIMIIFFQVLIALWNFNSFDNYLVSRLYKIKLPKLVNNEENEKQTVQKGFFDQSEYINLSKYPYCNEFLRSLFPKRCTCCKRSREENSMSLARLQLEKELNIMEIVKSRRYFQ